MKPIVYFFGLRSGSLIAYPQDHSVGIFRDAISRAKNTSQIIFHREDNLMYYCYVRRMGNDSYFGVCLCLDRLYTNIKLLFEMFDDIYADLLQEGDLLRLVAPGKVEWTSSPLATHSVTMNEHSKKLIDRIDATKKHTAPIPPMDFSISVKDCLEASLENDKGEIAEGTKRYCNIYIVRKNSEIERITSFNAILRSKDSEINRLRSELSGEKKLSSDLKKANISLRAKQKNMIWVGLLGLCCAVMFVVLYFKVINPSEVTHYETGEFVYYGPIKDDRPHGVGVAIYPEGDPDGRKYYFGNFSNGMRQDTAAALFYKNGDYFYGTMTGDQWNKGLMYKRSDGTYFEGTFMNNMPYDGEWYDHRRKHSVVKGEVKY